MILQINWKIHLTAFQEVRFWHKIVKRVYNIFRERIDLLGETKQLAKQEYERTLEDYPEGNYRIYIAKSILVCLTTTEGQRKFAPIRETEIRIYHI